MSGPTRELTIRQRQPVPIDRWSARRGESGGGVDQAAPMTLAAGLATELTRYPGDHFDTLIKRDRWPFFERDRFMPPGDSWVNWTDAGPRRPELHMRNVSYRREAGSSVSRFPYVEGSPTGGMHTMGPAGVARTVPRFVSTPQMTAARVNRLSPGQYANQTYSQTTALQGMGRVR